MDDKIIEFIIQSISLSDKEIEIIKELNLIQSYKKGTILLAEGEYARDCYFVLKGCVRSYYLVENREINSEFYIDNQIIKPVSYLTKQPSPSYLSCLENTVLALGNEESNKRLLEKIPKLESMVANLSENQLIENQIWLNEFKSQSHEQWYQKLMEKKPDLFQHVPLFHIASYLGITPAEQIREVEA